MFLFVSKNSFIKNKQVSSEHFLNISNLKSVHSKS